MALPGVVLLGLAAAAALLLASKDDDEKQGGGGAPGGLGGPDLASFLEVKNGRIQVKQAYQAFFIGEIARGYAVDTSEDAGGSLAVLVPLGELGAAQQKGGVDAVASAWMAAELKKGRSILMAIDGRQLLRSALPSVVNAYASPQKEEWAVLADPPAAGASVPIPGGGGATPGGTLPAGGTSLDDILDQLAGLAIPQGATPGGEGQGPVTGPAPGSDPIGDLLEQIGQGQLPQIPGMPQPGGGTTPTPPGAVDPYGVGSPYLFKVRPGDIPSALAQWYTGDFMRAEELRALNGLQKVGSGAQTYYTPWNVGQVVKLPLTWNVAKGLPAPGSGSQPATPGQGQASGGGGAPVDAPDMVAQAGEFLGGLFG
jgi:hypothetical protein